MTLISVNNFTIALALVFLNYEILEEPIPDPNLLSYSISDQSLSYLFAQPQNQYFSLNSSVHFNIWRCDHRLVWSNFLQWSNVLLQLREERKFKCLCAAAAALPKQHCSSHLLSYTSINYNSSIIINCTASIIIAWTFIISASNILVWDALLAMEFLKPLTAEYVFEFSLESGLLTFVWSWENPSLEK